MVVELRKFQVIRVDRIDLQVLPPEFRTDREFAVHNPVSGSAVHRQHWRMMRDLLGDRSPAEIVHSVAFERFAQQRIERFARSNAGGCIVGHTERSDVGELFARIFQFGGLMEEFGIFEIYVKMMLIRYMN